MSNDIDKSVNRLNAAETIRRQAIALQKHISEALAGLQTLSGSEDIQAHHGHHPSIQSTQTSPPDAGHGRHA